MVGMSSPSGGCVRRQHRQCLAKRGPKGAQVEVGRTLSANLCGGRDLGDGRATMERGTEVMTASRRPVFPPSTHVFLLAFGRAVCRIGVPIELRAPNNESRHVTLPVRADRRRPARITTTLRDKTPRAQKDTS